MELHEGCVTSGSSVHSSTTGCLAAPFRLRSRTRPRLAADYKKVRLLNGWTRVGSVILGRA
jgi:hypothetical protein